MPGCTRNKDCDGKGRGGGAVLTRFDRSLLVASSRAPLLGKVEASYQNSALVLPTRSQPRLTLLRHDRDLVPWGLVLPEDVPLPARGQQVSLGQRTLLLPITHGAPRAPCLVGAGVDLFIPSGQGGFSRSALREHLAWTASVLEHSTVVSWMLGRPHPQAALTQQVFLARARPALGHLTHLLLEGVPSSQSYQAPISVLVGLGPGLTPSGDDMIVGLLAAAHRLLACGSLERRGIEAMAQVLVDTSPALTTTVSREMILHSVKGAFPEPLLKLSTAMGARTTRPGKLSRLVTRLVNTGAHSGYDLAAGLLSQYSALFQRH